MRYKNQKGVSLVEVLVALIISTAIMVSAARYIEDDKERGYVDRIAVDANTAEALLISSYNVACKASPTGTQTLASVMSTNAFGQSLSWSGFADFSTRASGQGDFIVLLNVNALTANQRNVILSGMPGWTQATYSSVVYLQKVSNGVGVGRLGGPHQVDYRNMYNTGTRC